MRKKAKHSNSDDTALFRDAIGEVRPVRARRRLSDAPRPKPHATFSRADERTVLEESLAHGPDRAEIETGEELVFHRPHVGRKVLRQLRRGKHRIEDEIDLHGLTGSEAEAVLHDFIRQSHAQGLRCVRVVHGKGRGSGPRGPVLKAGVNRWLTRWNEVAAFCSAQPRDGGTGAIYVLIQK